MSSADWQLMVLIEREWEMKRNNGFVVRSTTTQAGFTLIEVIVALIVMVSMVSVAVVFINRSSDQTANQNASEQMRVLGDAAVAYVHANPIDANNWPVGQPHDIVKNGDWTALKDYLPPGISVTPASPIGVKYNATAVPRVVPGKDKTYDVAIYTVAIPGAGQLSVPDHAMKIAQLLGAGGFYGDKLNRASSTSTLTFWGAYGQLDKPDALSEFNLKPSLGLVVYVPTIISDLATAPGLDADEFLHRHETKGHPEWNQMTTDIDMNGNSLDLTTQNGVVYVGAQDDPNNVDATHPNQNPSMTIKGNNGAPGGIWTSNVTADEQVTGKIVAAREAQMVFVNSKHDVGENCDGIGRISTKKDTGELLYCSTATDAKTGVSSSTWSLVSARSKSMKYLQVGLSKTKQVEGLPEDYTWGNFRDQLSCYAWSWDSGDVGSCKTRWGNKKAYNNHVGMATRSVTNNGTVPVFVSITAVGLVQSDVNGVMRGEDKNSSFSTKCQMAAWLSSPGGEPSAGAPPLVYTHISYTPRSSNDNADQPRNSSKETLTTDSVVDSCELSFYVPPNKSVITRWATWTPNDTYGYGNGNGQSFVTLYGDEGELDGNKVDVSDTNTVDVSY